MHSLSGISSPANAAYSEAELVFQLKSSGSKALFTCLPLLSIAQVAAKKAGIPEQNIYLLALPTEAMVGLVSPSKIKTVDQMISEGKNLPPIEKLRWEKGQGARQTAFLCYSSGTSGLPVCYHLELCNSKSLMDLSSVERRDDIPQKCDCQRAANISLRETFEAEGWEQSR